MWKWILGAAGLAGAAGLTYAMRPGESTDDYLRKRKRNQQSLDAVSLDGGRRPVRRTAALSDATSPIPADQTYWEAHGIGNRRDRGRDIEALGRIIASEAGTTSRTIKRTVAWLARNRSFLLKRRIDDMAAPAGEFGPITAKRPMASSQPATPETRTIAAAVLAAPQSQDITSGSTHGFDASLQDRLAEQGVVANNAQTVVFIWKTYYGLEPSGRVENWLLYR